MDNLFKAQQKLIENAIYIKENHGACSLKLGTEAEANSFEDISRLMVFINNILPIVVKIGGCDARNDIRQLAKLGVSGIIAPMIESEYALFNFIRALKDIVGEDFKQVFPFIGINIESITGYENIDKILSSPYINNIDQITVGRTDMASSLNCDIDNQKITDISRIITKKAKDKNLLVSVGGTITPNNAQKIVHNINPDKVNIRTVVIYLKDCKDIKISIKESLNFELLLLDFFLKHEFAHHNYIKERIKIIRERINN